VKYKYKNLDYIIQSRTIIAVQIQSEDFPGTCSSVCGLLMNVKLKFPL